MNEDMEIHGLVDYFDFKDEEEEDLYQLSAVQPPLGKAKESSPSLRMMMLMFKMS